MELLPAALGIIFPLKYVLLTGLVLAVIALSLESLEFPTILALMISPYFAFIPGKTYVVAAISVLSSKSSPAWMACSISPKWLTIA